MPVLPAGLHQVGAGTQAKLGLSFGTLDIRARDEHDLHVVRVPVERNGETRGQLEERSESPLRVVAPEVRDLDSRSAFRIEVRPFELCGSDRDRLTGCRAGGFLRM